MYLIFTFAFSLHAMK